MRRIIHYLRARPFLMAVAVLWVAITVVMGAFSLQELRDQGGWKPGKPFDLFANEPDQ